MKVTRWLQSVLKFLCGHKQIVIKDLSSYSSKMGQRWDKGGWLREKITSLMHIRGRDNRHRWTQSMQLQKDGEKNKGGKLMDRDWDRKR